jgi:hypothetical protein
VKREIIQVIRAELGKRMGRFEGETLLQMIEEPLGGEEGAECLWDDVAEEVLKLRPQPWWRRLLGWLR